jgi:hypothetical protein
MDFNFFMPANKNGAGWFPSQKKELEFMDYRQQVDIMVAWDTVSFLRGRMVATMGSSSSMVLRLHAWVAFMMASILGSMASVLWDR